LSITTLIEGRFSLSDEACSSTQIVVSERLDVEHCGNQLQEESRKLYLKQTLYKASDLIN